MTSLQVNLGFSSSSIGYILGFIKIITSLISPTVSSLADTRKIHRSLMLTQSCVRIIPLMVMWFLVSRNLISVVSFFVLNSLTSILAAGLWPISDSLILASLGDKSLYGSIRLWGALTYGVGNILIGCLIELYSDFDPMFMVTLLTLPPELYAIYKILPSHASEARPATPITLEAVVSIFTHSASIKMFFANSIILGGALSLVESLLFVTMERNMSGSSPIIAGASVFISVMFEIPIFRIAPSLIQRHGTKRMMIIANIAYIIRAFGYAFFSSAYIVLLLELLHGVTFGLYYSAAVHICVKQCPPGMDSTMQSLLDMTYNGFGVAIGTILGGLLFDLIGSSDTFMVFAMIVVASTFGIGYLFVEQGQDIQTNHGTQLTTDVG
jgi:PPP family 3-phenylpropionic acid transporter